RYAVAGFTNLTQDHLDLHGSMAEYFAAKAMLFNDEHSVQRVVTLNGGAEPVWGQQLADEVPNAVTLDLGASAGARSFVQDPTWKMQSIYQTMLGHQFTLEHESGYTVTTRVGMPGKINIANAALAATMGVTVHHRAEWDPITAALQII